MNAGSVELPANLFDRVDETPDALFYGVPRLVTHIDDATIAALTDYYREALSPGGDILDVMSSWVSHLPSEMEFGRVAVLGMNAQELAANDRATETVVHDLNADPKLPYQPESFDAVTNAVSVQYLVNPVAVFASIRRVLRPGGVSIVAMSHRCFPTKAVRAFHTLPPKGRFDLVSRYCELAGGFDRIEHIDRSPDSADPLWIVSARRAGPHRDAVDRSSSRNRSSTDEL
ncbi:MAG: methyltransferase domain-containing protein [Myxococcota bacterium]